ncbi:MAG: hypothetical protein HY898_01995 [Deltaproteobacteria bacterium]|nr:hypothetical protein [Deltaproteobacteria bacterium]
MMVLGLWRIALRLDGLFRFAGLSLCVVAAGAACSLNSRGEGQDLPDAFTPDAQADATAEVALPDAPSDSDPCSPGMKVCSDKCRFLDDPAWGCEAADCTPCPVKHDTAGCSNGKCAVDKCDEGWGNCDGDVANGCETDLHTPQNCGKCGTQCAIAHGKGSCTTGACTILSCDQGFLDCNKKVDDGCEGDLSSPENCAACGNVCTVDGGGKPTCKSGVCGVSDCPDGFLDCNNDPADGCETASTTVQHCGTCANQCDLANAVAACISGQCAIDHCQGTFLDCDTNPATGCETDSAISTSNCGVCGGACDLNHASGAACSAGLCSFTCENGFFDCNGPASGASDDGCESEVAADPLNCGVCGRVCSATGVDKLACSSGVCTSSCQPGVSNCSLPDSSNADDGCETDILTSTLHCGACSAPCEGTNASVLQCAGGLCTPTCATGFVDCNGPSPGNADDGCEVDVTSDPLNCGACGTPCKLVNASSASCQTGLCTYACLTGWGDCNAPQQASIADGCELSVTADINNCGGCGLACGTAHVVSATCGSDKCTFQCSPGWVDCDHTAPALGGNNGCEINALTDVNHCGGCGRPCSGNHVDTKSCSGGVCDSSCDWSYKNCSKPGYPNPDDGCDTWGAVCW